MRASLFAAAIFVGALSVPSLSRGGAIDLASTSSLSADVTANLGGADGPTDAKEDHDTGDLSKRDVSASATASVPVESITFTGSGTATAKLDSTDNSITLTGKTSAALAGQTTLAGEVRSVATMIVDFTINEGFRATSNFDATIVNAVTRDEKVTVILTRGSEELYARTFDDSFGGSVAALEAGTYRVTLVSGSLATNKGIPEESGSADFRLAVNATESAPPPPTAIPLPDAWKTGAVGLVVAALMLKTRRAMFSH